MMNVDGVIFVSPVYAYNRTWLMKSFIDHFAYVCHRPRFHGKNTMLISTTGAVGLGFVLFTLGLEIGTWGYTVESKLGLMYPLEKILWEQGKVFAVLVEEIRTLAEHIKIALFFIDYI